jgi:hypothetical protein
MPRWRLGEENVGGGYNIYCGETRVAHTSETTGQNAWKGEVVTSEQAKANAELIVRAVNKEEENAGSNREAGEAQRRA